MSRKKSVKQRLQETPTDEAAADPLEASPPEPFTYDSGGVNKINADALPTALLTVPIGESVPGGNQRPLHIDIRLDRDQSRVLRRIANGLDVQGACLKGGRRVVHWRDALRWMFENMETNGHAPDE